MTDTRIVPPLDVGALKSYLPPEPADSEVARWRAAVARLDQAAATVRLELDEALAHERTVAQGLVDATVEGRDLVALLAGYTTTKVEIGHRLEVLAAARHIASRALVRAERTDPRHLGWREECQRIRDEWEQAMSLQPDVRVNALVGFATRHSPDLGE